ncbi:M48 family metalloprotease [Sulfuriflexus sp.]|uniref:M48 family metalloprotease n=1 Tax=Sulfuriflexus sp. TaxID=2015443 RepID=UPI0028CCF680|nr:M48 family metalloprotease [Sulfuriflexus sp.]MDT8403175.1 M48 family metalloprotease [Sulfuriflexus sp.]
MKTSIRARLMLAVLLSALPGMTAALDIGGFGSLLGGGSDSGNGIDIGQVVSGIGDIGRTVTGISEEEEIEIGRNAAAVLLGAAKPVDDPALQRYINKVGRWVVSQSERPDLPWRFCVLDTPHLNAFASPGGYVFITRGLLQTMSSESELAGVLAHEAAHVLQKHHVKAITSFSSSGVSGIVKLASQTSGAQDNFMATELVNGLKDMYLRGLDKEDEYEADRMGVVIAARAGYDPYGLASVLQTLDSVNPDDDSVSLMFKTHPTPFARLDELTPVLDQLDDSVSQVEPDKRFNTSVMAQR